MNILSYFKVENFFIYCFLDIYWPKFSLKRLHENLLSCFSRLFYVEEFKIQEDFYQISDLVHIENVFINRSTAIHSTNKSFPEEFLTEYHGSSALLSEKISASGQSVLDNYYRLIHYSQGSNFSGDLNFWILGANYNETSRINVKDDVNCGPISCYEESVKNGQICKPGRFCFSFRF